jgi:hypothetical protein
MTLSSIRSAALAAALASFGLGSQSADVGAAKVTESRPSEPKTVAPKNPDLKTEPAPAYTSSQPADLVKDWHYTPGFIDYFRKDEKSFAQIKKADLGKLIWVSSNMKKGLGTGSFYAHTMGPSWIARFSMGPSNTLQLIAVSYRPHFTSHDIADPLHKLAQANFPDSILGSWPIKASDDAHIMIDGLSLALHDFGAWPQRLEAAVKIPYGLDSANSALSAVASDPHETIIATKMHLAAPKAGAGARLTLPDARSALIEVATSFTVLPESPMATRAFDERVGYFHVERIDLNPSAKSRERIAYSARWRLEKKDPSAALSDPVEPIRFYVCPEMPRSYRPSVLSGILAWNKAFEAIGFKNAIEAIALDEESGILAGGRKATVCMVSGDDTSVALGPSKLDPRSGEILEARITIPELFARRSRIDFDLQSHDVHLGAYQEFEAAAADVDVDVDDDDMWNTAERENHAMAYFQMIITHEVGHTLGLRHNFKASAAYPFSEISKPNYKGPLSSSVMDYLPANVYKDRTPAESTPYQVEIGPYDMWAIAYGYSVFPDQKSQTEGLKAILSQSAWRKELAYATDDDSTGEHALDPRAQLFDLSADPLDFSESRFDLAQAQIAKLLSKARDGKLSAEHATLALAGIMSSLKRTSASIHRFFGGANYNRTQGPAAQPLLVPIDRIEQEKALRFLDRRLLSHYIDIPPEVLSRLVARSAGRGSGNPSFDYENKIEELQRGIIKPFFTNTLTDQIMDASRLYIPANGNMAPMSLREVLRGVYHSVWKEIDSGQAVSRTRRNLQRNYSDLLMSSLRNSANLSADPRSLFREFALELRNKCFAQAANPKRSQDEASHFRDIAQSLDASLKSWPALDKP